MDIEYHLGRSDLFTNLGMETVASIARRFQRVSFKQEELLCREGDPGNSFFLIGTGEVVVEKGHGIAKRELKVLKEGDGFGEMALISDEPRTATVRAITDVECLRLERSDFTILMDQDAQFAQRVLRMLSRRLRQTNEVSTQEILRAHQGLIISLAELAESRDADTGAHLYRVRDYCTLLAKLMANDPRFKERITQNFIESIYHVSPLHDIGKVAIPDAILKKKGKLTEYEFDVIKTHTEIGAHSLDTVLEYCDLEMFKMARNLILSHHECYDGTGYPNGISGEDIPLEARIMTIADFYDALLSVRVYKEAFSHEKVIASIRELEGTKFDPDVSEIMLAHIDQFYEIHLAYKDKEDKPALSPQVSPS